MLNRKLLVGDSVVPFADISIAHLNFTAADGTNINTLTGTNISGISTSVSSSNILECQFNALSCTSGANSLVGTARSTSDLRSVQPIGLYFDIGRTSTDSSSASFNMIVFADSVATLTPGIDLEGVGIQVDRNSISAVNISSYIKPIGGSATRTVIYSGLPMALSAYIRVVLVIQGGVMTSWKETSGGGGAKTMFTNTIIPGSWNDGNHKRIAFTYGAGTTQAGRFLAENFDWQR